MNTRKWLVALGLAVLVAALYARTGRFEAQGDFDDNEYVFANPNVLAGLTWNGVGWALTAFHGANWHPLTWISHMRDIEFFGPKPGAHHLVNAGLHAANSALLFLVLESATSSFWPSAAVAALFAAHPLNVETVAWISQRKSLVSTFFLLLAIGAYVRCARRRGVWRGLAVAALFALGLLAKPMLVSVPVLLLAMDFWPLGRFNRLSPRALLLEKVPLFALAAGSSVVTLLAQSAGGAVAPTATYPIGARIANALVSAVAYLRDAVWPAGLACFYPHPASIGQKTGLFSAVGALILLAAITALAVAARRGRPWLLFGWAWYAVSLAPVSGLVQVGSQARADRYTYVPMIGIFVAVVWEIAAQARRLRVAPKIAAAVAILVLGAVSIAVFEQISYWRNGETLYTRALLVTRRNWLASNNLGTFYMARGDSERALACFLRAARIKPDYEEAYYNEGIALIALSRHAEAVAALRENLRLDPGNSDGWANLGYALLSLRRVPESLHAFETALSRKPDDPMALHGAGAVRATLGDTAGALQYLARLERVDRTRASELRRDLGIAP